jgi:hypothetical protein
MTEDPPAQVLGQTTGKLRVDSSDKIRDLSLAMVSQARRLLDICSRHLDPLLYDNPPFVDAVKRLALASRMSRVRIIVLDPGPLVSRGHRLIELAGHLSSFIEIRCPGPDHRDFNEAMLIADETGFIHRLMADRFEGAASFDDPPEALELLRKFDEIWERGEPDPNFRRLYV